MDVRTFSEQHDAVSIEDLLVAFAGKFLERRRYLRHIGARQERVVDEDELGVCRVVEPETGEPIQGQLVEADDAVILPSLFRPLPLGDARCQ